MHSDRSSLTQANVQALFGKLNLEVMVLTILYSLAGLGIAIVNDFKSIEGDRRAPATRHRAAARHQALC